MAIDIIARGMIESSKSDISQLFDITKGGEIVNNESSYTLNNTVHYPLLGLNLYGKSTQNGTPTPENPVDIVSVGDSGSVAVTACGKNIVDPSKITNGGFDYASGTEINNSGRARTGYIAVTPTYLIGSVPDGYSILSIYHYTAAKEFLGVGGVSLLKGQNGFIRLLFKRNDGAAITTDDLNTLKSTIIVTNGESVEYEPYKGSTASITTALPLCGIPVDSGGSYTDSTGQQWVCDELIYNADGTGKIIKHIGSYTISSNSDVHLMENTGVYRRFSIWNIPHKNMSMSAPCTAYKYQSGFEFDSGDIDSYADCFVLINSSARFVSNATTVDEFIVTNTGVKFTYPLAEPQEIELSAAEMAELKELQSYDSVTNIYNNSGADMDVKYCTNKMLSKCVMPVVSGLQNQIDELKAAVLSLGGNV